MTQYESFTFALFVISYWLCNLTGEFREKFPLLMGEIQGQIIAADINDDGKVEIVTTDTRGNVAAWTNQGKELWEVHLKSLIAQVFNIINANPSVC
jgi:hypothetical protein